MGMFDLMKRAFVADAMTDIRASVELLLKEGKQPTEIARELGVSVQSIAAHIKNLQAATQPKGTPTAQTPKEPNAVDKKKEEIELKKLEIELKRVQATDITDAITKERLLAENARLQDKKERLERDIAELEDEKKELDAECDELNDECERLGVALDGGDDFGELSPLIQGLIERAKNGDFAPATPQTPPPTQQTLIPPQETPPEAPKAPTAQEKADIIWPNIPDKDKETARLVGKKATWARAQEMGIDEETFNILWTRMKEGTK